MRFPIQNLQSDLRYALRTLRKSPGFVLVAILAVAFSIGVNSAIFTLVNAVALRPLPVQHSGEVVTVYQTMRGMQRRFSHGDSSYFSYPEYAAYREQNRAFTELAAYAQADLTFGGAGARPLSGDLVSCNYFDVVTGPLALGQGFRPDECAAPDAGSVVVLSYRFWQSQYGGDPGVLGQTAIFNGHSFRIVGVAPEGFNGASVFSADVWAPLSMQQQWIPGQNFIGDADMAWLQVIGRLKPGVSMTGARAEMAVTAARLDRQNPPRQTTLYLDRATLLNDPLIRTVIVGVGAIVLIAVSMVLLIACANVANLLLARAAGRQKEIAVRLAVGASRGRLIGQLLTESLLLSLSGGLLGLFAAWAAVGALVPLLLARIPSGAPIPVLNVNPDLRVTAYLILLSFATGLGFGLLPALQATRVDLNTALKETGASLGGLRKRWLRSALVTTQVAVCLILLVATGLLARGLYAAQSIDPGFDVKDVTIAAFDLTRQGYDEPRALEFHRELASRLASQPGVEGVAFGAPVPLSGGRFGSVVSVDGREGAIPVSWGIVSSNYFQVLGIPMVRGRAFDATDERADTNLIVSESAARRFWPGQDPLGKRLPFHRDTDQGTVYRQVIGVARDIHSIGLAEADDAFVYVVANDYRRVSLVVRGGAYAAVAAAIRAGTRDLAPNVFVQTNPMEDNLSLFQLPSRITAILGSVLGFAGLLLAALGIYGVVSYAVAQRTREIGIRMSLGARSSDVLAMILAQGLRPVALGLAIGLIGVAAVSRILQSLLFGVSPLDPWVFAGVSIFLAAVATMSSYAPALRAARVDPMTALRHE